MFYVTHKFKTLCNLIYGQQLTLVKFKFQFHTGHKLRLLLFRPIQPPQLPPDCELCLYLFYVIVFSITQSTQNDFRHWPVIQSLIHETRLREQVSLRNYTVTTKLQLPLSLLCAFCYIVPQKRQTHQSIINRGFSFFCFVFL